VKKKSTSLFGAGTIKRLLQGVLLFNIADALLSIQLIHNEKILEEANPLMEGLLSHSPFAFVAVKAAAVCLGCFTLYKFKHSRLAQIGAGVCFVVYFLLMLSFYLFLLWHK